jgi:hypothetical protein
MTAFGARVGIIRDLPGSAARAASRLLRKRGAASAVSPHSFYVDKEKGPRYPGELAAARSGAWVLHDSPPRRSRSTERDERRRQLLVVNSHGRIRGVVSEVGLIRNSVPPDVRLHVS